MFYRIFSHLEHICVIIMTVFHHHSLIPRQREGDTVLPPAINRLKQRSHLLFNYKTPMIHQCNA